MVPAREVGCADGSTGARLPAGANQCALAVSAYPLIQSLRLIVEYKLLACLLADAELTDHIPVAVRIVRLEIVQQTAALTHQHQQTSPGGVVLLVQLEVLSQLANTFTENRNLHFRATRVTVMGAKARNNFGLLCSCQHGSALLLYVKSSPLSKCLTKNNMHSILASMQVAAAQAAEKLCFAKDRGGTSCGKLSVG